MPITNGDFETGDFTGWSTSGDVEITSTKKHAGTYSAQINTQNSYIEQDISPNVAVDDLIAFTLWYYLSFEFSPPIGVEITVRVTYTDESYTDIVHEGTNPEHDTWTQLNILASLTAGKTVDKIRITRSNSMSGWCCIDDVAFTASSASGSGDITITNDGGTLLCQAINWTEVQISEVAIRDVPTRTAGALVDTGTYVLKNRKLKMTVRLTDAQKTMLQAIFDANANCTITAKCETGVAYPRWTYTAWFKNKKLEWRYRKEGSNIVEWLTDLEFICTTFAYETL
jgi:hypothetical protein